MKKFLIRHIVQFLLMTLLPSCIFISKDSLQSIMSRKEITRFFLLAENNPGLSGNYPGSISSSQITVTLPADTTNDNYIPTISFTGKDLSPDTTLSRTFSEIIPVIYRVRAFDDTTRDYAVTLAIPPLPGNNGTLSVTSNLATSVNLSWAEATDTTTLQAALEYRVHFTENSSSFNTEDAVIATPWSFALNNATITSLNPNSIYHFNVEVRDEFGNTQFYTPVTIQPDLVAFYPFSGNSLDESGFENTLTASSPGPVLSVNRTDSSESAFLFDGSRPDYLISETAPASLDLTSDCTLSVWIYFSDTSTDQKIITKYSEGPNHGFIFGIKSHALYAEFFDSTETRYSLYAGHQVVDNTWIHLAVTYKVSGNITGYINAENIGSISAGSNPLGSTTAPLIIGCGSSLSDFGAYGIIDDIRIYKRALSQTEITGLYESSPD